MLPSVELHPSLHSEVAALLSQAGVPGACLALTRQGQSATLQFGFADIGQKKRTTSRTVYHLFSGTKLYTAAALMLLCERGAVDLDAPVTTYLDELKLRHTISVRQLASHCSGLKDTLGAVLAVHFRGTPMPSSAAALSRYATASAAPPGGKAAYRNVNYAILGELISRVTGVGYTDFIKRELLVPLNSGTDFSYSEEMRAQAATGYLRRLSPMRLLLRVMSPEVSRRLERPAIGGLVPLEEYALDTAAIGGLLGRAEDFLSLPQEMLRSTDGVLTERSKRTMLTLQSKGAAGIVSRQGVGIGFKRGSHRGVAFWNHEGGGAGFTSEIRIYPKDGLGVVLLMNLTQTPKLSRLAHTLCERLRLSLS